MTILLFSPRSRLPRALLKDGWWLETPKSAAIIPFPRQPSGRKAANVLAFRKARPLEIGRQEETR